MVCPRIVAVSSLSHRGKQRCLGSDNTLPIANFVHSPGEHLPQWPAPTHGYGPGLIPYVTYNQAVANIAADTSLHDVEGHKRKQKFTPRHLLPVNGNQPLSRILDTKGAKFLDPTGKYWPTIRQQMRSMTFPDEHYLVGYTQDDFTRQIGNAVPVEFMRQVFEEVIKTLRESDRESAAYDAANTFTLDDDDDVISITSIDDD